MSLFGRGFTSRNNIFSFRETIGSIFDPLTVTVDDLMYVFQLLENLEQAISQFYVATGSNLLDIDVNVGFQNITLSISFLRVYARQLYRSIGYPFTSTGGYDCHYLLTLYTQHPILRLYDFCENEPQCSYCIGL
jgi:hypothetical protein